MDRQRLADALAYDQARRNRLASVVPMPADGQLETVSAPSLRSNLENLSIGLGEGLTNQLEGVRALVTDPIGSAKGAYEAVRGVVRDPSVIAQALREMGSRAASGPLGAGEVVGEMLGPMRGRPAPDMLELDVYHGTPHRFPATEANPLGEFDASKIGTGEGAQAYGHGIYLAESPDVGKQYQQFLASRKNDLLDPGNLAASMMYRTPEGTKEAGLREIDAALKGIKNFPSAYPDAKEQRAALERAREILESGEELPAQGGTLYKADLPDEMIDRMLDWDKPLIEQKSVLKALTEMANRDRTGASAVAARTARSILQRAGQAADSYGKDKVTGASLYDSFLADEIPDQAQRSQFLKELGIPGIRYLDAGSRGQGGSGTRNFVVFPGEEKKVKILKRE